MASTLSGPALNEAAAAVEGCDGCISSHGQAAARAGAYRQEAAEAIGVTFLMHRVVPAAH